MNRDERLRRRFRRLGKLRNQVAHGPDWTPEQYEITNMLSIDEARKAEIDERLVSMGFTLLRGEDIQTHEADARPLDGVLECEVHAQRLAMGWKLHRADDIQAHDLEKGMLA